MSIHEYDIRSYVKSIDLRSAYVKEFLSRYGNKLQWRGGERVLDIGCGPGDVTRAVFVPMLPRDFKRLTCSDLSEKMLETARRDFHGMEHVDFLPMDIGKDIASIENGGYDKIFSTFCFMYVTDQHKAFQNVFNLLAAGGELFITLAATAAIYETIFQLAETPKWREHMKRHREVFAYPYREDPDPEQTIAKILKSIGFSDIFVKRDDFPCLFPTVEAMKGFIRCLPEFPNNMTQAEKEEFFEDQVKLLISLNAVEELYDKGKANREVPFRNITIYAKKP